MSKCIARTHRSAVPCSTNRLTILKRTKRNLTDGAVEKTDPKGKRGFEDHWAWKNHEAGGGSTGPEYLYRGKSPEAHLQKARPALHGRTGCLCSQGNERALVVEFNFQLNHTRDAETLGFERRHRCFRTIPRDHLKPYFGAPHSL